MKNLQNIFQRRETHGVVLFLDNLITEYYVKSRINNIFVTDVWPQLLGACFLQKAS